MTTIAAALLAILAAGLLMGPLMRRGAGRRVTEKDGGDLEDRQGGAFRELRDLELDFNMEKVDPTEYERSRQKLEDEVISAMKSDPAPAGQSGEELEALIAERRARWRRAAGASVVGLAFLLVMPRETAAASVSGDQQKPTVSAVDTLLSLEVRALNGTDGGPVPSGLPITLEAARGNQLDESLKLEGILGEDGTVLFTGVSREPGVAYRVSTIYQEAEYASEWKVPAREAPNDTLTFTVWEATEDPAAVRTKYEHIVVQPQPGGLTVQQLVVLENTGDRAYIGPMFDAIQQRGVVRVRMADGAEGIRLDSGLMECCVRILGADLVERMPLFPGTRQIAFSYGVKATDGRVELPLVPAYPLQRAEVFLPSDLDVTAHGGLEFAEALAAGEGGDPYKRLTAEDLAVGVHAGVSVGGLPPIPGLGVPKGAILIGTVISLLAGLVVVMRRQRIRGEETSTDGAHDHADAWTGSGRSGPKLDTDRDLIIERIAWLDEMHEAGAVEEGFYRRERDALIALARGTGSRGGSAV